MGVKTPLRSILPGHISLSLIGWLQWTSKKGYVVFQGTNLFLTPVNNWIHKWIPDWTRKWDPALKTSIVWPNIRKGIIAMLSFGMAGQFCDPIQGKPMKVLKPWLAPKGAGLIFFTFLVFWGRRYDLLPFFDGLDLPSTRGLFFQW